jgi:hypothetical protein
MWYFAVFSYKGDWKGKIEYFQEGFMNCHRCSGIMVQEKFYGIEELFLGWRCIYCGEVIDTFDGAKPRFLNRGKKRHSVSTLSMPRASDRGVEWVDSMVLENRNSFGKLSIQRRGTRKGGYVRRVIL